MVDDGSTDMTAEIVRDTLFDSNCIYYFERFETNQGRLVARNAGMSRAKNDWICWLDSDDEYVSTYLSTINAAIAKFPDAKLFNFGAVVFDEPNFRSWTRDTFLPALREDGRGHVAFKSGGIGTGSFVFKRELSEEIGLLPETRHPYGNDDSLPALATRRWPELKDLYGQNETGQWLPFGNPWGDDWLYFYLLTRNHVSIPLDINLYIQHLRH